MYHQGIEEGMHVRGLNDENLGKIVVCDERGFIIEKGFFFPKEYRVDYTEVRDVRDRYVYLNATADTLLNRKESYLSDDRTGSAGLGSTSTLGSESLAGGGVQSSVSVPVTEEQLNVQKHVEQSGEVSIDKTVEHERQHIDVPVTHEEVRVERVPGSGVESAPADAFQDKTIKVPITEERVSVEKTPVVREEVRVTKTAVTENENIDETTRKERVKVDEGVRKNKNKDLRP
jgi:uncharacterized protein (TIGR02271 family)